MECSKEIKNYFENIEKDIKKSYKAANEARKQGYDPELKVEIPLVSDMAERVEGLISAVYPHILGKGISKRIKELEKKWKALDWRIALQIALEIAQEKFCKFKDKKEAMEVGIRTGFAYHTMGVVASPLEGFVELLIKKRKDGKEYLAVSFAGPIRSAGGTGASVSVLIVDYVRKNMGYDVYDPTEDEIKRFVTELYDYHERITNLQYLPSEEEIEFLAKNLPVQITGGPSEKIEVSNYKDLERVGTANIRNGVCLVLGEGIAQKAPKLLKQLSVWGHDVGLEHWDFIKDFVDLQKKIKAKGQKSQQESKISPDFTFIKDIVAGRPIFTHPMRIGGFRLRYGRSRTSGFSAYCISPLTMAVLKGYLATGTQLKLERPGKATSLTSCDSIEGPVVKIEDGSVIKIDSNEKAKEYQNRVKEILFMGDILINYGDFFNRAHKLVPPGYCPEWWIQELEKSVVDMFGTLDLEKLSELVSIPRTELEGLTKNPLRTKINIKKSINISKHLGIPLHPDHTFFYLTIDTDQLGLLLRWFEKANILKDEDQVNKIVLPIEKEPKRILEVLGVPHIVSANEYVVIQKHHAITILETFKLENKGITEMLNLLETKKDLNVLEIINRVSPFKIMDKAGLFVGARMGRPEKAKQRKLTGSPQVLFPVGEEGGRLRCFQSALEAKKINAEFPLMFCTKCNRETIYSICEDCHSKTRQKYNCYICGTSDKQECEHGSRRTYSTRDIDIKHHFENALEKIGMRQYPDLIKGVRGTLNKSHVPEQLAKGILRAKHDVYVNKDGTTRYDMTQLPITHFKPKEIRTSVEKLKELGYMYDLNRKLLENDNQVLELKPQDIILPACIESPDDGADKVLFNVGNYIDDLLVSFYKLKPFYNFKTENDVTGHLVACLAPHTSSAIVARVIGFSATQGFFAHPLLHAATRRDCDGDEACVSMLMDTLLNFSKHYLPAHRGSTQDASLVMTSKLIPSEVDDMVFDMDIAGKYPLEFYNACLEYKNPWEVKIEQISQNLGKEKEYYGMKYTHDTDDINFGERCSVYKTLPTMEEKLKGQMELAEQIRAVDESDVARLIIEKHFLKDTKGNLRKFSMQQFRCVKCNEKYRRPPLTGKCKNCKEGKIIFTISEGSVIKYLQPSISIANKYNVKPYLKQTLELLQRRVEGVFGKEKEKQEGLGKWFG